MDELELLKKRQEDNITIRSKAAAYAKRFLVHKYNEEYRELYNAYLSNRGYSTRNSQNNKVIDERTIGDNNVNIS